MRSRTPLAYFARFAKALQTRHARHPWNPPCRLELQWLEERAVPSCNPFVDQFGQLTAACDNAANTFTLDHSGTTTLTTYTGGSRNFADSTFNTILINVGTSADVVNIRATVKVVLVRNAGGLDIVNIGKNGTLAEIGARIGVINQSGETGVAIDDHNRGGTQTATVTSDGQDEFIDNLTPGGIFAPCAPSRDLVVYTGTGAVTANVLSTCGHGLNLHGNSPSTTVNVGNAGSLAGIQAQEMTISSSNGDIGVSIDDHNRGGTRTATFSTVTTSAQFVSVSGLAPGTIYAQCAASHDVAVYTGPGAVTANVLATCGHGLNLHGNSSNTNVNVGNAGSLAGIQAQEMTISNSSGDTGVAIDDRSRGGTRTATFSTVTTSAQFVSVSGLASGTIYSQCAASHDVAVYTGPGVVTANVLATCGHGLNLDVNSPNTTVNVGNAGNRLDDIRGLLSVNGQGSTILNINDQGTSSSKSYDLLTNSVQRVLNPGPPRTYDAVINYANIGSLNVNGGIGGNVFSVLSTVPGTSTTINGGSGNNTLNGPPAPTGFNIAGSNAGTLSGGVTASFSNFQNLIGGSGNDNFIFADAAGISGNISDLGGAADTLDYSAYSTPVTVDLSAGTATGVAGSVQNIVTLRGGAGDDSLTGNAGGGTIFFASPGNDTVTGLGAGNSLYNADANGTADSTWSVTAQNGGTLTFPGATTTFSGMQNLDGGGTGLATFVFADGAGVDGNIQGSGSGTGALNYAAYRTTVIVDLQTGSATGVGGVSTIRNVTGGQGANILVGDGNENLTGGPGQNLIISGGGTSQITGGGAGDILIGGITAYDTDDASLQAILSYWTTSGDDYRTRVANLRAGNGVPQLEGGITVFDNGAANTLTGNGNEAAGIFNLFYVTEAGTVTDQQPDEVVVDIDNPAGAPQVGNHGGSGNLSRESLSAATADLYFLRHWDEMNEMDLFVEPVHGRQTSASSRVHPAIRATGASLEGTASTLDLFAPWQPER